MENKKTHYRAVFNSPYLSSADIVEPTVLTIKYVAQESDKSKKTKDKFNTAYFVEKEIRPGEQLKPMILNATNSRTMATLTGSKFIEEWSNTPVTVYVDPSVRFGKDTVEGLRISSEPPRIKKELTPENNMMWKNAVAAYIRDGNFNSIETRVIISDENKELIKKDAKELGGDNVASS